MTGISASYSKRLEVMPCRRDELQRSWVQAPLTHIEEGVMVSTEKQTIPAVVTSVVADRNDVCRLDYLRRSTTQGACLTAITPNDCCSKRCLTALLSADLFLWWFPSPGSKTFLRPQAVGSPFSHQPRR